jgi:SAM-dependent methyltransferase
MPEDENATPIVAVLEGDAIRDLDKLSSHPAPPAGGYSPRLSDGHGLQGLAAPVTPDPAAREEPSRCEANFSLTGSAMPDLIFADDELAALYDAMNPGRDDYRFYLPMIMAAASVLDVGCGTGVLLHEAREAGHRGRLCGLDPAPGMLAQARRRTDIRWILSDLSSTSLTGEFQLIVMTGHAFQVLVEDDDLRVAVTAVRDLLGKEGRFAFETRNPRAKVWESWDAEEHSAVVDPGGVQVRMSRKITAPFDGRTLSFRHTFHCDAWAEPRVSRSTLRFLDTAALDAVLKEGELVVEAPYGDWDRSPLTDASPKIITIARRG